MKLGDQTPWGEADYINEIVEGVSLVGTPSHGGIMVRKEVSAFLSERSKKVSIDFGDYICFEEDCALGAVFMDMPSIYRAMTTKEVSPEWLSQVASISYLLIKCDKISKPEISDEAIELFFRTSMEYWYPEIYTKLSPSWSGNPRSKHGTLPKIT